MDKDRLLKIMDIPYGLTDIVIADLTMELMTELMMELVQICGFIVKCTNSQIHTNSTLIPLWILLSVEFGLICSC